MGDTAHSDVSELDAIALAGIPQYPRSANAGNIPLYAYAPSDPRWEGIGADLKPAVCRLADGMASRVERQQLSGNGVCPMVAAIAFATLYSRFED